MLVKSIWEAAKDSSQQTYSNKYLYQKEDMSFQKEKTIK